MMTTDFLGLYVHIPFCLKKCNYCDFCSFPVDTLSDRGEYIDVLCREILGYRERELSIDSIFFGGGTPSLLTEAEFDRIYSAIKESFNVLPNVEFTLEANPKTLDAEKLAFFKRCGVNRLSIGLQSIHENEMKILGRVHGYDDFLQSYAMARAAGINNINIDLMYGIPNQTEESFKKTIDAVLALSPEHISLYGLMLEEGTPFFKMREKLNLPDEDSECDMYYYATNHLAKHGYSHYEISNYARSGHECRHNLKYWRAEKYIGVGLAAYSYFDGYRFGNTDNMRVYLSDSSAKYKYREKLSLSDEAYEYVMLRLRLAEGFSLSDYKARFNREFLTEKAEQLEKYIQQGYIMLQGDRISLTERGFYISNSILADLT